MRRSWDTNVGRGGIMYDIDSYTTTNCFLSFLKPELSEKPKIIDFHWIARNIELIEVWRSLQKQCIFLLHRRFLLITMQSNMEGLYCFWKPSNFNELDISYYSTEFNNFWFFWKFRFKKTQKTACCSITPNSVHFHPLPHIHVTVTNQYWSTFEITDR